MQLRPRILARTVWPLLVTLLAAGCAAPSASPAAERADESGVLDEAAWAGGREIPLLVVDADIVYEADAFCLQGGGPHLPRDLGGRVLQGATGIRVEVEVAPTFTGMQVGHVVTAEPGSGESTQQGIEWLPVVPAGERASFTIALDEGPFEEVDGPTLWQFYYRMRTPAPTDCYTGGGTGTWHLAITAVR